MAQMLQHQTVCHADNGCHQFSLATLLTSSKSQLLFTLGTREGHTPCSSVISIGGCGLSAGALAGENANFILIQDIRVSLLHS